MLPKTGSTTLTQALIGTTGFRSFPLLFTRDENEQDLYLPALIDAWACNTVTQQHLRATTKHVSLPYKYRIRLVVLAGNPCDIVVSIRDHPHNGSQKCPMSFAGATYAGLSERGQFDTIIDLAMPWSISVIVSWTEAVERGDFEPLWLT